MKCPFPHYEDIGGSRGRATRICDLGSR